MEFLKSFFLPKETMGSAQEVNQKYVEHLRERQRKSPFKISLKDGRSAEIQFAVLNNGSSEYLVNDMKSKKQIGRFYVRSPIGRNFTAQVTNASLEDEWQKSGIATFIYDMIEEDAKAAGSVLEPQWGAMSEDALEFWEKRRPGTKGEKLFRDTLPYGSGLSSEEVQKIAYQKGITTFIPSLPNYLNEDNESKEI